MNNIYATVKEEIFQANVYPNRFLRRNTPNKTNCHVTFTQIYEDSITSVSGSKFKIKVNLIHKYHSKNERPD
jgi:hypothetical protein